MVSIIDILTATTVFTRAGGPLAKAVFTEHDFGRCPCTKKQKRCVARNHGALVNSLAAVLSAGVGELIGSSHVISHVSMCR